MAQHLSLPQELVHLGQLRILGHAVFEQDLLVALPLLCEEMPEHVFLVGQAGLLLLFWGEVKRRVREREVIEVEGGVDVEQFLHDFVVPQQGRLAALSGRVGRLSASRHVDCKAVSLLANHFFHLNYNSIVVKSK